MTTATRKPAQKKTTRATRKPAAKKTTVSSRAAAAMAAKAKAKAAAAMANNDAADQDTGDAAETEAVPTPLDQARQEAGRLAVRYRRQLTPLGLMAVTDVVGVAADAAGGVGALGVVALAGAGTATAYVKLRPRLGRWGRAYAAVACGASVVWEATAAAMGVHQLQALLWLGGSAMALPWWIRHSERTPDVAAEETVAAAAPEAEPETPAAPDPRSVRWGQYLGTKGGALAGSKLSDITEIEFGWTATIDLGRGEHWSKATGCCNTIAGVFDLPDGHALIEPLQGRPNYLAHLTVLTVNPLEEINTWTGPGLDVNEGTFRLALTADGEWLNWRLWRPGSGMCHGLVAGTTGSGKSATVDLLLSEVAKSDRLFPIIIDGSGGASVPDWLQHVKYKATTVEETIELLERIVAAMDDRFTVITQMEWTDKKGRKRRGRNSIDPTPQMPGIVLVIDEAHRFLMDAEHGKTIRRLIEIITQMGRKVAAGVVLATQQASVSQLGGSSVIRDMCKSGNVVALRTGERISGGMVGNVPLPEPLHTLPTEWPTGSPTQGLGYVTTARAIRSRVIYVEDPYDNAEHQTEVRIDARTEAHLNGTIGRTSERRTAGTATVTDLHTDDDAIAEQVAQALEDGVDPDPAAIARITGLTWRQAKTALNAINN